MDFYIGLKVPVVNQWLELTTISPHRAESDAAVQVVHDSGDFVRAELRPSPSTRREGTLDRLIGTPSPLDDLLREDTLGSISGEATSL
jgi:hypothetical protein